MQMGQQSSRLLELSSTKFTSTGLHHSVCTMMTRKDIVAALWLFMLVCSIGANFSCKPEQIIWTNAAGKARYQCLDCPSCPAGSEPSVPCGTKIENWTDIHCVPFQLGKTYSNKYDKAHCKPCTVCSTGKAILKNCTLESNSKCSRCKEGYYYKPLSFSCDPCSECCGDEKDLNASECSSYKHKCKVRSTPCKKQIRSTKSTLRLTKPTPRSSITLKHQLKNSIVTKETRSSMMPTRVVDKDAPTDIGKIGKILLVAVAVVVSFKIFVAIVITKCGRPRNTLKPSGALESTSIEKSSPKIKARCKSSRPASQSNGSISPSLHPVKTSGSMTILHNWWESSDESRPPIPQSQDSASLPPSWSNAPAHVEYAVNPEDVTLEKLEENHHDVFDWMCTELEDNKRGRWDFESLAFQYKIQFTILKSLKNAFQRNGSPCHELMDHLKATHPNLPLHHVINNLEKIGRNDIAQGLRLCLKKNGDISLA